MRSKRVVFIAAGAILVAILFAPARSRADGAAVLQTPGSLSALGATFTGTCNSVQTPSDNINESCHLKLVSGTPVAKNTKFSYSSTDGFGRPVQCLAVLTPFGNAEVQCRKANAAIVFVAGIRLGLPQPSVTDCFAAQVNVNVDALDSGGNVIFGPYLDSGGNPLTITLTLADGSHSTSLSATSLISPTPVTLNYNGQPASSATVSASAPGLTTKMATLNMTSSHSLYVTDERFFVNLNDAVAVFSNGANGNVSPLRLPNSPRSQLANPFGIAIDNACNMYVSNFAGGANIATGVSVFPVSANGTTAPTRMFTDITNTSPNSVGLALDPVSGNIAVAYQGFDEIAFFAPTSSGAVTPVSQLMGSATALSFPGPIAFDAAGDFFVGNFGSQNVTGYAKGAQGNTAPTHTLTGDLANAINFPAAVAVDSSGSIYVANTGGFVGLGVDSVTVYAPGANGYPAPTRTITGNLTQLNFPAGLAVDSSGNLYVLNGFIGTTAMTVYDPSANGNVAPIRTITSTALGSSSAFGSPMALDGAGNLYVLDLASPIYGRAVLTFAANANGPSTPINFINDPAPFTTLNANRSTSLAVDAAGNVYVGSTNTLFNVPNAIMVFGAGSSGKAVPIKTITNATLGDTPAMGVDSSGNIYAMTILRPSQAVDSVFVFDPSASGVSTPIRTLDEAFPGMFQGSSMAVDPAGNVVVTGFNNIGGGANSVSVYAASTNGSATPSRVIRGGAQGVFSTAALAFDGAGNLYVLNIGDQTVKVYAPGADGLAAPIRTIQGIPFLALGILVDTDGTTYVSSTNINASTTNPSAGMILVYAPGANGMAAPIRTIAGSNVQLNIPRGLTFGP